jgi:hypothetical protein
MKGQEMLNLTFDQQLTAKRVAALDSYFNDHVMKGNRFICSSYSACEKSHTGTFYKGQLHHVGSHYDTYVNNQAFRVIVVGQEYGHKPSFVSLSARQQMVLVQTGLQKIFTQRNPHMRGTTSALRLLYGLPLRVDHNSEFLRSNSERFHIYDAFALVNYLLCSAVQEDEGKRGKATIVMKQACLGHFSKAVEILEPTVMIVQSKGFWDWVRRAFDQVVPLSNELYLANFGKNTTFVGVFAHPSTPDNLHNWGRSANTQYLVNTVAPTMKKIRELILGEGVDG